MKGRVFCPLCQARAEYDESASVPEDMDVIVEADQRAGGPAERTAACAAAAALDPHDVSVEALSIGAVEAKPHGAREGGCAAAVISACPTAARAVQLHCRASGKGDSDRFLGPDSSLTLLPLLEDRNGATVKLT